MAKREVLRRRSFGLPLLILGPWILGLLTLSAQVSAAGPDKTAGADIAAARALFEKNLQAIRDKNRDDLSLLLPRLRGPGPHRPRRLPARLQGARRHRRPGVARSHRRLGHPSHARPPGARLRHLPLPRALRRPGGVRPLRAAVRLNPQGVEDRRQHGLLRPRPECRRRRAPSSGATLVDGTGAPPVPDAVVVLRDGKIDCAGSRAACPVPAGVDVTDLTGLWITPGLVDAHVHFSQTGWADGRPDSIDVRGAAPLRRGRCPTSPATPSASAAPISARA